MIVFVSRINDLHQRSLDSLNAQQRVGELSLSLYLLNCFPLIIEMVSKIVS